MILRLTGYTISKNNILRSDCCRIHYKCKALYCAIFKCGSAVYDFCVTMFPVQRWVRAFYADIIHLQITTTNGLERQHEELKYNYLSGHSNGSLTDLITAVVTRFVPDSQSK